MDSASEAKEKVVKDSPFHSIKHSLDHENIILCDVSLSLHWLKLSGKDFLSSIFREHFKPQSDQSQFHEGSKDQGIDFYELLEELTLLWLESMRCQHSQLNLDLQSVVDLTVLEKQSLLPLQIWEETVS